MDPSCPTQHESFEAGDCESEAVISEPAASGVNVAALGGAIGTVIVLLILVIAVLVVVILLQRTRKQKKFRYENFHITIIMYGSLQYLYLTVPKSPVCTFAIFIWIPCSPKNIDEGH